MPGLFGFFDYTKPGKGIDKDTPEKHPFFLFFELLWRKLGRLILLNMIYFVFLIPLLTAVYYVLYGIIFSLQQQAGIDPSTMMPSILSGLLVGVGLRLPALVVYVLLAASIVLYGPASCGLAFMLRNFARQQHAWNSDFFDKLKQNFKQGLGLGLLDILLLGLFAFNIAFTADFSGSALLTVARYGSMAVLFIYLLMRNYVWLMAVTFDLRLSQLLKNAWIFAVMGLWRNLLVLVVNGALFVLAVWFPGVELLALPFLLFSLTGFVTAFTCWPVIQKHMIDPQTPVDQSEA